MLGSDDVTYGCNVTAMEDSSVCYLDKTDVIELREQHPDIETNMSHVLNQRKAMELPRNLFARAAGQDGKVGRDEMKELLKELGWATRDIEETLGTMNTDGNGCVDELNFESWYRCYEAELCSRCRVALNRMTLGELVEWMHIAQVRGSLPQLLTLRCLNCY
jgi:CRP-like cAMP-binding protein